MSLSHPDQIKPDADQARRRAMFYAAADVLGVWSLPAPREVRIRVANNHIHTEARMDTDRADHVDQWANHLGVAARTAAGVRATAIAVRRDGSQIQVWCHTTPDGDPT